MKIEADAQICFPRALVFATYRDRLSELVPYLPNVKRITPQRRVEDLDGRAGVIGVVNFWEASGEVPRLTQSVLKPEMLAWYDHASWDENHWTVAWRIETRMFTESVRCAGVNVYRTEGDRTILEMRGDLELDLKTIPGVPRFVASTVGPAVEKFIVGLLTPNLTAVARGLEAFLSDEQRQRAGT